jgi:hypothetical protein
MTLADPLADVLDVMAINTYNGWYTSDRLADLPGSVWHVCRQTSRWSFPNSVPLPKWLPR